MKKNGEILLKVNNLEIEYKTLEGVVKAVNGLNIELNRKRTLGLVGETGAGKTTTALSIMRLIPDPPGIIKSGEIILEKKDILTLSEKEMRKLRGKDVAMIFQDPMTSLNPTLTIKEQISEVLALHENLSRDKADKRAEEMLELVGIQKNRSNEYPHQFSGGMKQRVIIAIALACSPKLLIADEPTTALDVTIQAQVLQLMKDLKEKFEMSLIMITHSLGIVAEICDDVSVMYAGRIVEHGKVHEVFKNTRHPYTEGLFGSLPVINKTGMKLRPIPGLMPDPIELPMGCSFWPRCAYAVDICKTKKPEVKYFSETHYTECHRYQEISFKIKRGQ